MISDKDILADVLNTEKNMVVNMAISLNEASCDSIYNVYYDMFDNLSKISKTLFKIAYNKNWYTLEESQNKKIESEYNKLEKELENI